LAVVAGWRSWTARRRHDDRIPQEGGSRFPGVRLHVDGPSAAPLTLAVVVVATLVLAVVAALVGALPA